MLVPLRGGWKPSIQLQVMNKVGYPLFPFPFTQARKGVSRKRISKCSLSGMRAFHGKSTLQIGVIDAESSGQMCKALASSLVEVKAEFPGQAWHVCFDLLYSETRVTTIRSHGRAMSFHTCRKQI